MWGDKRTRILEQKVENLEKQVANLALVVARMNETNKTETLTADEINPKLVDSDGLLNYQHYKNRKGEKE